MNFNKVMIGQKVSFICDYNTTIGDAYNVRQNEKALVLGKFHIGGIVTQENPYVSIRLLVSNRLLIAPVGVLKSELTARDSFILNLKIGSVVTVKKTIEKIYEKENMNHLKNNGKNIITSDMLNLKGQNFRVMDIDQNSYEVIVSIDSNIKYLPFYSIRRPRKNENSLY